jgi:hypothetical protein
MDACACVAETVGPHGTNSIQTNPSACTPPPLPYPPPLEVLLKLDSGFPFSARLPAGQSGLGCTQTHNKLQSCTFALSSR